MTGISISPLWPTASRPQALVDPVAFTLALVLSPLIVGVLGAPVLLIPTFAVVFGGPAYLLIGTPLMWAALRRGKTDPDYFFGLGLKTIAACATPIVLFAVSQMILNGQIREFGALITWFAFVTAISAAMAGVWGAMFATLYRRLRNPNFPA